MSICGLTSVVTSVVVRQRLPLIGAFILYRSFGSKTQGFSTISSGGIRMESSSTVPSIVVYVTVPNKDAGVTPSLKHSPSKVDLLLRTTSQKLFHELRNAICSSLLLAFSTDTINQRQNSLIMFKLQITSKKLAASIVKEKLAACVNRVPGVESVYLWQGEIQTDSEELLIIKTRESLLDALTEHVKANHEYDVPEVIALPITGGSIPYLEWLKNSTRE